METKNFIRPALLCICLIYLTGCTVGPDFRRPAPPDVAAYTSEPLKTVSDTEPKGFGTTQHIITGQNVANDWWRALNSEKLDVLIAQALERNPTLMSAAATLNQAQQLYVAKAGSTRYPQVEGNLSGQRQRFNPGALGQADEAREFSLFYAGAGVNYSFDLSGGNRRALEALAAQSSYQQHALEGARLSLIANIVTTAITQASLKEQIEILRNILKAQKTQLELTQTRIHLGHEKPEDALALQMQAEQTRSKLPPLYNKLQQNRHLMAVLVGETPAESTLPSFRLDDFTLPSQIPLTIPSELVRQRPDILGAEALLHAANAEYGVAVAKLYPQLNLSADPGSQALTSGALFGAGSSVWSILGQLTQPLFNPGLPAEKRAALASFNAAAAKYKSVVLEAFRNVADTLQALENDSKQLEALWAANKAAEKSSELAGHRYDLGAASPYELLAAEQNQLQTKLDLVEVQASRLTNTVAFYQAMGGGIREPGKGPKAETYARTTE